MMSASAVFVQLIGGVALLIWAVRMVRTGVVRAFGSSLRAVLASATRNRTMAAFAGAGVTVLMQSATATAMLLTSFSRSGLVPLAMALAVVLGADVGSAIAAQLLSLDVSYLWPVFVTAGVFMFLSMEADRAQCIGRALIGLGLLTLSLQTLRLTVVPLAESETFGLVLAALGSEPVLAAILAAGITWAAHSSLAVVLVIATLALTGAVTPTLAIAAVLGANVGAAAAPLSANWGGAPEAKRVPLGNMLMRGVVAAVLVPFSGVLADIATSHGLVGARLTVDVHLAFNIVVALIFIPLVGPVSRLLERLVPAAAQPADPKRPRYLGSAATDMSSEALAAAHREALALGDRVEAMLVKSMEALETGDPKLIREIRTSDDAVDAVNEAIKLHLVRMSRKGMSEEDSRRFMEILSFTTNLEHIGDVIDKQLLELAEKKGRGNLAFSSEGLADLRAFHARVASNFATALNVFATGDTDLARRLFAEKTTIRDLERHYAERHYARLRDGVKLSMETTSIHMDVLRDLKRIHGHFVVVAQPILEACGELSDTRLRASSPAPTPGGRETKTEEFRDTNTSGAQPA